MKINILNLQKKIPINNKLVRASVVNTLASSDKFKNSEINICFLVDNAIKKLNFRFLGLNNATDVISFEDSHKDGVRSADLAISVDTACRNAKFFKTTVEFELCLYVIHGLLHLLGYDDNNKKNRERMDLEAFSLISKLHFK